jgi:hypothetical protein
VVDVPLKFFLKQHGLSDWWFQSFTAEEDRLASERFSPLGFQGLNLADTPEPGETTETAQAFLRSLAGWFRKGEPEEAAIRLRLEAKADELFDAAERPGDIRPADGIYRGRHYTEYVEQIKQLKRDGHLDEAAVTLRALLPVVFGEAAEEGSTPAPWYSEQLAIVETKRSNLAGAVEACDGYLAAVPTDSDIAATFEARRDKALRRLQRDA